MVVSFKRAFKTSPSCWVIGSGGSGALLQMAACAYFTWSGKHVRPALCSVGISSLFTLPLLRLAIPFYCFFNPPCWEIPTLGRCGVNGLDSTLTLREKCPTYPPLRYFLSEFLFVLPHVLKPGARGQS